MNKENNISVNNSDGAKIKSRKRAGSIVAAAAALVIAGSMGARIAQVKMAGMQDEYKKMAESGNNEDVLNGNDTDEVTAAEDVDSSDDYNEWKELPDPYNDERDAQYIFASAEMLLEKFTEQGLTVSTDTVSSREVEFCDHKYGDLHTDFTSDGVISSDEFLRSLYDENDIAASLGDYDSYAVFEVQFEGTDKAEKVAKVTVAESFTGEMKRFECTENPDIEPVEVPDVIGLTYDEAVKKLNEAGFENINMVHMAGGDIDVPYDTVVRQSAESGSKKLTSQNITLFVYKEVETVYETTIMLPIPEGAFGEFAVECYQGDERIGSFDADQEQTIIDGAPVLNYDGKIDLSKYAGSHAGLVIKSNGKQEITVRIKDPEISDSEIEYCTFEVDFEEQTAEMKGDVNTDGLIALCKKHDKMMHSFDADKPLIVLPDDAAAGDVLTAYRDGNAEYEKTLEDSDIDGSDLFTPDMQISDDAKYTIRLKSAETGEERDIGELGSDFYRSIIKEKQIGLDFPVSIDKDLQDHPVTFAAVTRDNIISIKKYNTLEDVSSVVMDINGNNEEWVEIRVYSPEAGTYIKYGDFDADFNESVITLIDGLNTEELNDMLRNIPQVDDVILG